MWHVSSRSSEATSRTAIHLLLTYSFCYPRDAMLARAWASAHRGKWGQLTPLPWKNGWKIKKRKYAKRAVFYVYILRAIIAGRCNERRYADHMFIQIGLYFRMHHFVVKFSKFSSPGRQGSIDPLTKILQTFLDTGTGCPSVSVWPCLCLSQVGVISKRMDEIIWVLAWGLFSTSPLLRFKKIQISTK